MARRSGIRVRRSASTAPWSPPFRQGRVSSGEGAVGRTLAERQHEIVEALAHTLAATWELDARSTRVLEHLIERLLEGPDVVRPASPSARLLCDLEKVVLEGRTEVSPIATSGLAGSGGRRPLRLGLPFQGPLKALRALNAARIRLDRLPWSGAEVAHFSAPLRTLGDLIGQRLRQQLLPRLRGLLDTAGFVPGDSRQEVARNVLQEELFTIILRRWHLRFTDLRDALARDELRLPDPGARTAAGRSPGPL